MTLRFQVCFAVEKFGNPPQRHAGQNRLPLPLCRKPGNLPCTVFFCNFCRHPTSGSPLCHQMICSIPVVGYFFSACLIWTYHFCTELLSQKLQLMRGVCVGQIYGKVAMIGQNCNVVLNRDLLNLQLLIPEGT